MGKLLGNDTDIRIYLPTEHVATPVYVGQIQSQNASFSPYYLNELLDILTYDLNYSGYAQVAPRSPDKEKQLGLPAASQAMDAPFWMKSGLPLVMKWNLSQQHLNVTLFIASTGLVKHINEIPLSGNLSQDRRQIHKLSDCIIKTFFKQEGIAHTRILYCYQVKNSKPDGSEWVSEVWECDWDGANARQVTREGSYCVTPTWLPKQTDRFLYVSYKWGQPKICIAHLKEGVGERLISLQGNQLLPAISPTKDQIAFISDAAGRADLFIQPFDPKTAKVGKPIQLYSYPRATQASPTFSPDGKQLAFVSDKDGGTRIYLIDTTPRGTRSSARLISKKNRENSCPSWSPDGKKIAFSAKTGGVRQIWIYDFETDEEWQLTSGNSHKENPCWASDSLHLVFNSTNTASSELYVVNLNQKEIVKISSGHGHKHYPTWSQ